MDVPAAAGRRTRGLGSSARIRRVHNPTSRNRPVARHASSPGDMVRSRWRYHVSDGTPFVIPIRLLAVTLRLLLILAPRVRTIGPDESAPYPRRNLIEMRVPTCPTPAA